MLFGTKGNTFTSNCAVFLAHVRKKGGDSRVIPDESLIEVGFDKHDAFARYDIVPTAVFSLICLRASFLKKAQEVLQNGPEVLQNRLPFPPI